MNTPQTTCPGDRERRPRARNDCGACAVRRRDAVLRARESGTASLATNLDASVTDVAALAAMAKPTRSIW